MGYIVEKDIRQTIRSCYDNKSQSHRKKTIPGEFANFAQIRGKDQ
jgi:hypothetical protein